MSDLAMILAAGFGLAMMGLLLWLVLVWMPRREATIRAEHRALSRAKARHDWLEVWPHVPVTEDRLAMYAGENGVELMRAVISQNCLMESRERECRTPKDLRYAAPGYPSRYDGGTLNAG